MQTMRTANLPAPTKAYGGQELKLDARLFLIQYRNREQLRWMVFLSHYSLQSGEDFRMLRRDVVRFEGIGRQIVEFGLHRLRVVDFREVITDPFPRSGPNCLL